MEKITIDYDTMRENCIQIHQEVHELYLVANHIGEDLGLAVKSADELITHPETKSWDGMGRYAKMLYDKKEMWDKLPNKLWVVSNEHRIEWIKDKSRNELLNCHFHLGGKKLY